MPADGPATLHLLRRTRGVGRRRTERFAGDAAVIAHVSAICDEFETDGSRRVGAELRHQGVVVNGKKLRRLMREHERQPKRRRRFTATTDSNHDGPIFPDLAPTWPRTSWWTGRTSSGEAELCPGLPI